MNSPNTSPATHAPDTLSLTDLERAINFWRKRHPSTGEEQRLCAEANALAEPYALAIVTHRDTLRRDELDPEAQTALDAWFAAGG